MLHQHGHLVQDHRKHYLRGRSGLALELDSAFDGNTCNFRGSEHRPLPGHWPIITLLARYANLTLPSPLTRMFAYLRVRLPALQMGQTRVTRVDDEIARDCPSTKF